MREDMKAYGISLECPACVPSIRGFLEKLKLQVSRRKEGRKKERM